MKQKLRIKNSHTLKSGISTRKLQASFQACVLFSEESCLSGAKIYAMDKEDEIEIP